MSLIRALAFARALIDTIQREYCHDSFIESLEEIITFNYIDILRYEEYNKTHR